MFALLLSAFWTTRPVYTIRGCVYDHAGAPLIGATVQVKGTQLGAVTDLNGCFELQVPDSSVTLVVHYTGYQPQEASKVRAGQVVRIQLDAAPEMMMKHSTPDATRKVQPGRSRESVPMIGGAMPAMAKPYEENLYHQTEDYDVVQENRFYLAKDAPVSTFSIDVDAASYSNLRRFIKTGQMPPKDAVRIEEMLNYFRYDYPQPQGEHPFEVVTELSECPWQPQHKLLHLGLQGKHIPTDDLPPSNLVFLIDVSGSMAPPNRLPLVKSAFRLLVNELRPQDRVAIVVYAGAAGLALEPASGNEKTKILEALDKLEAGGSTAGGAGIRLAYKVAGQYFAKGGNNRVILATDGDFNVGVSSDAELVRIAEEEREKGIFLTVLGFGMGNYKDNKLQKFANAGNGHHAYIDDIDEARKVFVQEFGGTLFTIAKDVKIQVEFNPSQVAGYRLLGYENRMLQREDFNDDRKDAGELGSGHTVTALYEIIPAGVSSAFLPDVDPLKYQRASQPTSAYASELATVKLRYKQPDGAKSQLLERIVPSQGMAPGKTSDNFRWSAAVAQFGMLLRQSEFKGAATYQNTIALARSAKGKDEHGYRAECIRLMETVRDLNLAAER